MTPEISHRCPACGASIRDFGESVLFCPECGKPLAASAGPQQPAGEKPVAKSAAASPDTATADRPALDKTPPPAPDKTSNQAHDERATACERTRETLQRASRATRGAIEDNV